MNPSTATVKCRSKNPASCRFHGFDIAKSYFADHGVVRNGGLHGDALESYKETSESFIDSLPNDQMRSVFAYTASTYREINAYLRGGEAALHKLMERDAKRSRWPLKEDFYEMTLEHVKNVVENMDTVMKKAPVAESPRVLYKAFRVFPKGKSTNSEAIKAHVEKSYEVGKIYTNAAYTSTSLDSDYMLTHCKTNGDEVIVHEILTDKGLPVSDDSGLQAVEREVILPREMKLQVVGIKRETYEYSGHQPKLSEFWGEFDIKPKRKFTVIQFREVA